MSELVLRGIFTLRRFELDWYYQHGASLLFPDKWERFLEPIPEAERGDLIAAYRKRLTHSDPRRTRAKRRGPGASGKARRSRCFPTRSAPRSISDDDFADAFARIENHYFVNAGWLEEGQLHPRRRHAEGIPGGHHPGPLRHGLPAGDTRGTCTAPGRRRSSAWSKAPATPSRSPASCIELIDATDRFAANGAVR